MNPADLGDSSSPSVRAASCFFSYTASLQQAPAIPLVYFVNEVQDFAPLAPAHLFFQ